MSMEIAQETPKRRLQHLPNDGASQPIIVTLTFMALTNATLFIIIIIIIIITILVITCMQGIYN